MIEAPVCTFIVTHLRFRLKFELQHCSAAVSCLQMQQDMALAPQAAHDVLRGLALAAALTGVQAQAPKMVPGTSPDKLCRALAASASSAESDLSECSCS